jgi:hypothetical protein
VNLKKAKQIRRIARQKTIGADAISYQPKRSRIVHRGPVPIPGRDYAIFTGDVRLEPSCTRAVYQALKRAA